MNIYIVRRSSINSVFQAENHSVADAEQSEDRNRLKCHEPDYTLYITDPMIRRRMSRAIKMGVTTALQCLNDYRKNPDAIITATGLGCLSDTEKFLRMIHDHREELLNPTPFIQSTFNTIGAQIAIALDNTNYNNTYVHRGFSFESALIDALMILSEGEAKHLLLGSYEELTDASFTIFSRLGVYRKGGKAGEGAQFFILSTEEKSACRLKDIAFAAKVTETELQEKLNTFLERTGIRPAEIDCLVSGESGNREEQPYYDCVEKVFPESSVVTYKHRSGDYPTVTSFALWLSAEILQNNEIPPGLVKINRNKDIKKVLIYNHYRNINHSFILIEKEFTNDSIV